MRNQDNTAGPAPVPAPTARPAVGSSFPPEARLHSNRDYGRVFHRQQKAAGRWVVVLITPRGRKGPARARLGVMVGVKAVKTAVRRHALKRWTREVFRTRLQRVLHGHDCVVLFRCDIPDVEGNRRRFDDEVVALANKALATLATPGQRGGGRGGGPRGPGGRPAGNPPPAPPSGAKR